MTSSVRRILDRLDAHVAAADYPLAAEIQETRHLLVDLLAGEELL